MNNNQASKKFTFYDLLREYKIEIPIIQRDYAQGRAGKEEIRENFLTALQEATRNGKKLALDFVYGSVKDGILQPLDGQQRLTTLFLLHWYIAVKENKLDDELKALLDKFTYETRTSSREFCHDLINKGIGDKNIVWNDETILSERISDRPWFFLSWKKDPTIKAMLTMLDAIHKQFSNKTNIWDNLGNISFHYIELKHFGLSDDLYIKMNARGKPLTDFENFKAKFEQLITKNKWEENIAPAETFSYKVDTNWTDLFWNYRDKSKNVFDQQLMNFFKTWAKINNPLIDSDQNILALDNLSEDYFRTLKVVLNKISDKNGVKEFLNNTSYVNEKKLFNGAIENNENGLGYADLVKLFALYQYVALEENIEREKLTNWMRVIRNLVEGSRPYSFNNATEFSNALDFVKKLLEQRNTIDQYLAETKEVSLSGFLGSQVAEEQLKSRLILQNDEWKDVIIKTENHGYFNGQIGFLLDWSKNESGQEDIEKFKIYIEKAKAIFDDKGLRRFENNLFERALLATGDYLLSRGRNNSFLINNERDISWKRLLRDRNEKRSILKQLIDKLSISSLAESLQKIIDDFSDKNDWRYYFIQQPEMIAACGTQKLIRKNKDNDILLLGSTTTSGYHKEYYSYSLFVKLRTDNPDQLEENGYCDQRSVNDRKYFEFNSKQVAFDCNSEVFIFTQNNNWDDKQELGDTRNHCRKDILRMLTANSNNNEKA